jgi:hypothetical protein
MLLISDCPRITFLNDFNAFIEIYIKPARDEALLRYFKLNN